jgi:hypothetical protein
MALTGDRVLRFLMGQMCQLQEVRTQQQDFTINAREEKFCLTLSHLGLQNHGLRGLLSTSTSFLCKSRWQRASGGAQAPERKPGRRYPFPTPTPANYKHRIIPSRHSRITQYQAQERYSAGSVATFSLYSFSAPAHTGSLRQSLSVSR